MNEISSYQEIKINFLMYFLHSCIRNHSEKMGFENVYGWALNEWDGVYIEKIENLMFTISAIISTGGWAPKSESYLRNQINYHLSKIDLNKELKNIKSRDACELIQDMHKIKIPFNSYPKEYLSHNLWKSDESILKKIKNSDKPFGYHAIKTDLLSIYWIGCRDYGFNGWTYNQTCEWAYFNLKNRYKHTTESLMLKIATLGLTGGWNLKFSNFLKDKINLILLNIDLNEAKKNIDWNYSENDEHEFNLDLKRFNFIN